MNRALDRVARATLVGLGSWLCSTVASASPPAEPQWQPLPDMQVPRVSHASRWVPDVGLTIASGRVPSGQGSPTVVEALDLDTLAWTTLEPAPLMSEVASTSLLDGRWLLFDEGSAHIHDPVADTWTDELALAETYRARATLSTLADGDVLIVGGFADFDVFGDSLRYDPSTGAIIQIAALGQRRAAHTATNLPSGSVLVAGGWAWSLIGDFEVQEPRTASEIYEPDSGTWIAAASMTTGRERHAAVLLESGEVLACGGLTLQYEGDFPGTAPTASAELYDPGSDTWTSTGSMLDARYGHTITRLPSGVVIVTGGMGTGGALASAEVYDPDTQTWTALASMSTPRLNPAATLVPDHGLVVSGGSSSASVKTAQASVELYPLGHAELGSACSIDDECSSARCSSGGVCVAGHHHHDGGDSGYEFDWHCGVDSDAPRGRGVLVLGLGLGLMLVRRRRSVAP